MIGAALGLLLLWALFVPSIDPWTQHLVIDPRLSVLAVSLIGLLAALALGGRRLGRAARFALAAVLLAAALLQVVAATVLGLLDRPLDLYFDLPQVPSLVGLFTQALRPWRAAGAGVLAVLGAVLLFAATAAAIGACEQVLVRRRAAGAALSAAVAVLAIAALPRGDEMISFAATKALADQGTRLVHAAAVMNGLDHRYDAVLAAPAPQGDLAALAGRDVFLVFVESYGTVALDDPTYRAAVAPALQHFEAAARDAGYGIRSSRLVSPVFGAGSWLAHGTLASGLKLDPFLDRLLVASGRPTLGRVFGAAGHRVVAVMPGIKKPWPEAGFWGFAQDYFAADLGYAGPQFGWFDIPDQYTLDRFDERELGPGHAPLFAEIVLVSSHTPFAPVPPYLADWNITGAYPNPQAAAATDLAHLDRPYLDSLAYDFATLGGWLARLPQGALVIVLGDHQPPGLVSGATAPWTVPIYVLSRDPALLAPFAKAGYIEGTMPPRSDRVKGMESFLGEFLADFSTGSG